MAGRHGHGDCMAPHHRREVAKAVGGAACVLLLVLQSIAIVCILIASLWNGGWTWLRAGARELVEIGAGVTLFFAAAVGFACSLQTAAAAADRIIADADRRSRARAMRSAQGSAAVPAAPPHGHGSEVSQS